MTSQYQENGALAYPMVQSLRMLVGSRAYCEYSPYYEDGAVAQLADLLKSYRNPSKSDFKIHLGILEYG